MPLPYDLPYCRQWHSQGFIYLVNALVPGVYPIYSWTHAWFWLWFVVELVEHFPVVYGLIVSLRVATFLM